MSETRPPHRLHSRNRTLVGSRARANSSSVGRQSVKRDVNSPFLSANAEYLATVASFVAQKMSLSSPSASVVGSSCFTSCRTTAHGPPPIDGFAHIEQALSLVLHAHEQAIVGPAHMCRRARSVNPFPNSFVSRSDRYSIRCLPYSARSPCASTIWQPISQYAPTIASAPQLSGS